MKFLEKLNARNKDFAGTRPVVMACLGDSVTHGCFEIYPDGKGGLDVACRAHLGYAARLQKKLGEMYPYAMPSVINAGVSGGNAAHGLERLERDVLSFKPDLVILNFALNDAMNPDVEKGLQEYRENMREIMSRVLASGAECILLTPNYMNKGISPLMTYELFIRIATDAARVQNGGILTRYVDAAREEAQKLGVPVADAYAVWQAMDKAGVDTDKMLSNDINHPTEDAHDLFVNELMRVLLK